MTAIESKEIRGLTLKVLYLLVAFSITATVGIMGSWFSLKTQSQELNTQIEVLKTQVKGLDTRMGNMEARARNLDMIAEDKNLNTLIKSN